MARNAAKGAGKIRKDVADEEISPELLDELAERANALGAEGDDEDEGIDDGDGEDGDDDADADAIIDADDEDSDDLDDDADADDDSGLSGDDDQDVGDNFDSDVDDSDQYEGGDDDDDDSDDDDEDDDLDDDDDDADDDEDDEDRADDGDDLDDDDDDEGDGPDTDEDEDKDVRKDMTADAPDTVDEDEVENTQPEDGDGKKKNEATKKSIHLAAELRKAIDAMVAHGSKNDPSMRQETLMAKKLHGGALSKSERVELARLLIDGEGSVSKLQKSIHASQAPDEALAKSMVSNETVGLMYDKVTESLLANAEHLENSCAGLESTQFLMAKALTKVGETVAKMADEQARLRASLARQDRAPVAAPRSVGVDWARKSLAGARVPEEAPVAKSGSHKRLAKASPSRVDEALQALCKSADPKSEMGRAYASARDAIAIHRPLMPSIAAKVEEYLADH